MTKDEARQYLIDGEILYYFAWTFVNGAMNCGDDCCFNTFKDVEETLSTIEEYAGGFEEVEV